MFISWKKFVIMKLNDMIIYSLSTQVLCFYLFPMVILLVVFEPYNISIIVLLPELITDLFSINFYLDKIMNVRSYL